MKHKVIKLILWVEDVGSVYICYRECSSIPPSVLPACLPACLPAWPFTAPFSLSMLTPLLSSCYCCWGCFPHPGPGVAWTHTHTQSTHMSTCPQACKHTHTHTVKGQSGFLLSVLQSSPHSSVEHTVQRVRWHLGRYHSHHQPNKQLNGQEHTIWWPRRGQIT